MQLVIEQSPKTVTVITPSIGSPKLLDAISSVATQFHKCKHLIVIDGPEFVEPVPERSNKFLQRLQESKGVR